MSSTGSSSFARPPNREPVRRIVTGHTPEGKSVVLEDAPIEPHPFHGSTTLFSDLFWTTEAPPDNGIVFKDLVKDHPDELYGPTGTSFKVVEMPPGAVAPFHRTISLDYGIVTHGQITLILDDDKRTTLKAGDVIIQRGTIHGWLNEGTEWTRLYFVMIPSQRVKVGDKELELDYPTHK